MNRAADPQTAAVGVLPVWEQYEAWNVGIEREIFSGQWEGQPVYLDLEEHLLESIARGVGSTEGTPAESLTAAVRPTLHPLPDRVGLFAEHLQRERKWRLAGSVGTPPFLAVLAFLSLVAEGMRSDEVFRASNYYGRLEATLGVEGKRGAHTKLVRGFMDESHVLWTALNTWLEDHEGRLGLPTAYAFDYRVHVGVPMSQALVTAGDRLQLRDLFIAYRLRPGQSLSRSDMLRLIQDWLPASGVSQGLKKLSRQREALERVADVASVELQAWDGTSQEVRQAAGPVAADLLLSAVVRRHPRPRLHLDLLVHSLAPLPAGEYRLDPEAGSHASAALEGTEGTLTLLDGDVEGWTGFSESALVSMPDVMFASLRMSNGEVTLRRSPVRLAILEYDEEGRRYVEVNRVTLGRDNLLLCHESLVAALDDVLPSVARAGFRKRSSIQLPGLPDGWVAYDPVEILAMSDTSNADLAALVPLSWTQVSLGGGYPLPSRLTWLRGALPEVRASSLAELEVSISLTCERALESEAPPPHEFGAFTGSVVLRLDADALPDGDYRVAVNESAKSGSTLGSSVFRVRSADHPRALSGGTELLLGYDLLSGAWGAVSAQVSKSADEVVRGAAVPANGHPPGDHEGLVEQMPRELRLVGGLDETVDSDREDGDAQTRGGDAPLCLMGTSGHHWVLEDGGRYPWMHAGWEGTCKHCGLDKWFPRRPGGRRVRRGARGGSLRSGSPSTQPATSRVELEAPPIQQPAPPDLDMLLEALSFAQQGAWGSFDTLAAQVDDTPWFPLESARLLTSLGHIDLQLNGGNVRPERWSIAPPTLAILAGDGGAVLSGYRSGSLVGRLREAASARGGRLVEEPIDGSPAVISVEGLTERVLHEVAQSMQEELGVEVRIQPEPASRLIAQLPDLDGVVASLPTLPRPLDAPVERFDFEGNCWTRVDEVDLPGAYRFVTRPLVLAVRPSDVGELRRADNRLVKWAAAHALGIEILSYDPDALTLRCPLGAQLPGLYERAAVLGSGRPPTQRTDGTVTYGAVDASVAAGLWARLVAPAGLAN